MGKGGRIACIFTPFGLTIATAADLSNFHADPNLDVIKGTNIDNALLNTALKDLKTDLKVGNYYSVFLQNYCKSDTKLTSDHNSKAFCSHRKAEFWFNPVEVWGLNNTGVDTQKLFPKELNNGLKAYKTVSKWMYIAYACALATTIVELVVGLFAICSRWGSFFTTLFSAFSFLFTAAASITATALFSVLGGAFNTALKPYGIKGSIGRQMMITTWLAVAFSLGASFFWTLSVCCCSGRSPYSKDAYNDRKGGGMKMPTMSGGLGGIAGKFGRGRGGSKRVKVEKTPYTYERVESPYLGAADGGHGHGHGHGSYGGQPSGQQQYQNVPMLNLPPGHAHHDSLGGPAYEPYRHV
ncbi:MAG: hypothetical protein Q9160_004382 [Pyrenula sp. 1 TL-2023]